MANPDLKESVLLNLRSVTQSCKGGVPFERLQRDYRDLLGSPIPFRELGYNSLEAFIRDIPHVISLRKNSSGQLMAEGVADASTAHIVSLVSRQKADVKKKAFRKPPPYGGMRKTLSYRYAFREAPRGYHSHAPSRSPPYKAKPTKSPPAFSRSKPLPAVSQSRPYPAVSQSRPHPAVSQSRPLPAVSQSRPPPSASQSRSPPAALHSKSPPPASQSRSFPATSQSRTSSAVSSQFKPYPSESYSKPLPAVSHSKLPPTVSNSKPRPPPEQVPSRKYDLPPRFQKQREKRDAEKNGTSLKEPSSPTSPPAGHLLLPFNDSEVIPPPRAITRALPVKPPEYRTFDALESARTAKEFVEIYAKMHDLVPVYRTVLMGQKAKSKGYVSTLRIGEKSFQSYPEVRRTEELAEEEAANIAMLSIKEQREDLNSLPETPYSNADEIRILLSRIEEITMCLKTSLIVCEKPSGMFANGIVREYEAKFGEKLPSCWLELLKQSSYLDFEETKIPYGKVPDGANIIVRATKELSSGNQTPSSTSSKDFATEDLDSSTLKKTLVDISLPKVPEFKIPTGNFWDVYVTCVSGWFSARILDYQDDFLALSDEMSQFYQTKSFPVVEAFQGQIYAACFDDNPNIWHRVIVEEVKEEGQLSCYFVDEGDFSYIKKENLQEMNASFLNLPYQAIQLSLDGLEEYEQVLSIDILEDNLLGKTLIAEVKRWHSLPDFFPGISSIHRTVYYVTLYNTENPSGEDVNLNELLKVSTIESLKCELPKLSSSSCAYLSHVTPEGLVYLRLTNPQECWIEHELERLSPVFEEASVATTKIPFHTMCAAKYESGTWHRALVTERLHVSDDPEVVEVFFVDYGHVGVVGKSEICELYLLTELLAMVPHQAICCELLNALPSPGAQWTELAASKLLELAPYDQELIIRVMSEEDGTNRAKVNLYKRNLDSNIISINDSLACNPDLFIKSPIPAPMKIPTVLPLRQPISCTNSSSNNLSSVIPDVAVPAEEQMAKRLGSSLSSEKINWLNTPDNIKSPDAFEISPVALNLPPVPDRGDFDVYVTMAAHPHNFVVQPLKSSAELTELMQEMQSFYSLEENFLEMDFSMLSKNEYYAALHSDGAWYRVRIEQIINDNPVQVAVHYVDFGDFNHVCIGKLQPLYRRFRKLPCQAIKASLAGVKPIDSDWDPVQSFKFQEMVKEKSFVSFIHKKQVEYKEDIPSMHLELTLIDTMSDNTKDIYIHELLVEKNIAKCH